MVDKISKKHRSWNMSKIRSVDTKPELFVRKLLHNIGFRFRLNGKISKKYCIKGVLIGKPDIVLAGYKTVIFIHGCFWHRHTDCKYATTPKTRTDWWLEKLNKNVERDNHVKKELKKCGWKVIIVWECETSLKNIEILKDKLNTEIKNDRLQK
ncbi:MAG: DNA mismatch endonuclease Vsr [Pseudomonadota bacterium]